MSKQNYNWKRFWCSRSGRINLADGGYLWNPDEEHGRVYNTDVVSLEAIADVPCLVLLGEPGIGKSRELENIKLFTEENNDEFSQVLELNLRSCTNLKDDLFRDETVTDWLAGSHHLYLFLDSLDEGLLSIPNLAAGLIDEIKKPKYQNHIDRLSLRLACRTFVFPASLEEELKELWEEANFAVYELVPLRRTDVIEAAKTEGFSPDNFLKEINYRDIVPLAIKPITLNFLLSTYRRHNGQFPPDQKLYELYLEGCRELCTEPKDKERHPLRKVSDLLPKERLIVAARIAAITIFSNRFAVWSGRKVDMPSEDVFLDALCYGYENINGDSFEITDKVINEVLDTGLFSSRGLHRMGWAHQTYAEFLAAWYLTRHEIPLAQIKKLIFSSEDPDHKLIPQLHETAAWLASMRLDVLQNIIKTDPDVLLQTDVPTDAKGRASIVDNLLKQYEEGRLFNRGRNNYRHYGKLKHPGLVEQLRPYICDHSKQIDARDLAIDIAEVCELDELQTDIAEIALASCEDIKLRTSAARAISKIGSKSSRLRLKPLAVTNLVEDKRDDLKGYCLKAAWRACLDAQELFTFITPLKKRNYLGPYKYFLNYELVDSLSADELVPALDWLSRQEIQKFNYPFEGLSDELLYKAWLNFESPQILEKFTKVAILKWRHHRLIISLDKKLKDKFKVDLLRSAEKRHQLIQNMVKILASNEQELPSLISYQPELLVRGDIFWMLDILKFSNFKREQKIWATLIKRIFRHPESMAEEAKAILEVSQINSILFDEFLYWAKTIDLDSAEAVKIYTIYLQEQAWQRREQQCNPPVEPPPKERVLRCLDELELGDLSAWWQLSMEMTLEPNSQFYGNGFELDLTSLPGWKSSEESTQQRIINAARTYVQSQDDIPYSWIVENNYIHVEAALGGVKALYLLLKREPGFVTGLSSEIWKKWTPAIVAVTNNNDHEELYLDLVQYAYRNSSEKFVDTLRVVINRENQKDAYISVIHRLKKCWDKDLGQILLERATDPSLKPKCMGQLLEELLKQEVNEARKLVQSLISVPLSSIDEERERTLVATNVLIVNSEPLSWEFLWSLIKKNSSFGQEALKFVVSKNYSGGIPLHLSEKQLADLYLWIVRHYPHDEDPNHDGAHPVSSREEIAHFRDDVLAQLKERGTLEACAEIKRLIQELPNITWLRKNLIEAQANMRRKTWQPPTPEEFLQFVISQEPSNLDLSNQLETIDQRTKKMEDEPKIENRINISNSPNSPINAPIGTSGVTNSNVTAANSDAKKGVNWGNWLTVIGILVAIIAIPLSMSVSGAFNAEFKEWFNQIFPSKIEQQPAPESE